MTDIWKLRHNAYYLAALANSLVGFRIVELFGFSILPDIPPKRSPKNTVMDQASGAYRAGDR